MLPYFTTTPPKESVVLSGKSIEIPCEAKGLPIPMVQIIKQEGGNDFPAVAEKRVTFKDSFKFGIENLKIEDSGLYICSAISSVGTSNATMLLTVIGMLLVATLLYQTFSLILKRSPPRVAKTFSDRRMLLDIEICRKMLENVGKCRKKSITNKLKKSCF